jgi:hypothetical protein
MLHDFQPMNAIGGIDGGPVKEQPDDEHLGASFAIGEEVLVNLELEIQHSAERHRVDLLGSSRLRFSCSSSRRRLTIS